MENVLIFHLSRVLIPLAVENRARFIDLGLVSYHSDRGSKVDIEIVSAFEEYNGVVYHGYVSDPDALASLTLDVHFAKMSSQDFNKFEHTRFSEEDFQSIQNEYLKEVETSFQNVTVHDAVTSGFGNQVFSIAAKAWDKPPAELAAVKFPLSGTTPGNLPPREATLLGIPQQEVAEEDATDE